MTGERELIARLRIDVGKGNQEQTKKIVDDLEKRIQKVGSTADEASRKFARMREQAERLQQVSMTLGMAGAAIMAPMALATNTFVQKAGMANAISRQWLATNQRIEQAQMRIGQVAAQAALPDLQKAAELAERIAKLVEQHPEILKLAAGAGSALLGAPAIGNIISSIQKTVEALGLLLPVLQKLVGGGTAGGIATAASGAAAGAGTTILGVLGSVLSGAVAGFGVNELIANSDWGKAAGFQNFNKIATVGAYGLGKVFGGEQQGLDWARQVGLWTGAVQDAGNAAESATEQTQMLIGQGLENYINYQKQLAQQDTENGQRRVEIERQYEQQRTEATREYAAQRARLEQQYQRQLQQLARSYRQQELQAEQQYNRQRLDAAKRYGEEARRAEEDHQKEMRRMSQDHQGRMDDLAANRDALGMMQEMRSYEKDRQRAEEDFITEQSRRRADFAQQMADLAQNFADQRSERIIQYQQQLADLKQSHADQLGEMDAQYQEQLSKLKENKEKTLKELEATYQAERKKIVEAFQEQLVLSGTYGSQMADKFFAAWETKYRDFLRKNGMSQPTNNTGRALGGYANFGTYTLGESGREYVLNNSTTRTLEQMLRGSLTQENIVNTIKNARADVVININRGDGELNGLVEFAIDRAFRQAFGEA